jgi:hypothetical protein
LTSELHSSITSPVVLHAHDADLGDAVIGRVAAGRLQIDEYQILRKEAAASSAASIERQQGIVQIGPPIAEHAPRLPVAAHRVQVELGGEHGLAAAIRFGDFSPVCEAMNDEP